MGKADYILMAKGWQVFALMQLAAIALMLFWFSGLHIGLEEFAGRVAFGTPLAVLELGYFGWMLAVGASMNARVPNNLKRGLGLPALGLAIAVIYLFFSGYVYFSIKREEAMNPGFVALHLFSMTVNFYLLWFLCRSLIAAEEQHKPSLDKVLGIFFALWFTMFVPVAAWWVQNRARRVAGLS
jgi:hypothetical protein